MQHLLAAVCLSASLTTEPATGPNPPVEYSRTVVTRATTLTRALAQRVHLEEGQYVQVKRLHLQYIHQRQELETQLAGASAAERDQQLAAAQQAYEQALNEILLPVQRVAYQHLRAQMTAHRL